jgi:molecular chaperone DnaK
MVKDAEANAAADQERREKIDLKNQADSLAYQAEKQIGELGDKVPADEKEKIEGQIKALKDVVAAEDYDQMKSLTTELQQALYAVSANLYQQAGGPDAAAAGGPTDGAPDGGASGDDVIDAEFTEPEK